MSSINMRHILLALAGTVAVIALYVTLLFFQNGTTLIVTMDNASKTQLRPQVYYSTDGTPFNETNSVKSVKNRQNTYYYFDLPDLKSIQYVRFDPSRMKTDISIYKVTVSKRDWFITTLYEVPISNLLPNHQIENVTLTQQSISFQTTGNDPQLNIRFLYQERSKAHSYHPALLFIALLIVCVLFYLIYVYKNYEKNTTLTAKLILYGLFFAFALFKVGYYKDHIRFGYPPDELAHLSYIDHVNSHKAFLPSFENMTMINNRNAGNYLSHPPLYYYIMSKVHDDNYSITKNVDNFRTFNAILFAATFLLILYLGFSTQMGILGHFVYLSLISSIPMFAYLGGSITNDNLAMLGGIVFMIGLKRMLEKDYSTFSYLIIGLGVFISYFSKLTVAIMVFFAIVLFFIYLFKSKEHFKITKFQFLTLILFTIPILVYQFYIFTHYHAFVPTFNVTHPEQYLTSGFFIPEENRAYLSATEWLLRMKQYFVEGWFAIHSHHSLIKNSVMEYIGILLLHLLALIALFWKCDEKSRHFCILGKIGLISFILLMVVQFTFSYKSHLNSGYMGGLQPRYLLPFMFAFAIMSSLFVERFKQYFLFNILIIMICIHAIYSDFFYFLQYYQ